MAAHTYNGLIRAFMAATVPGTPAPKAAGPMEFTVDESTCTVFPLEGGRQLVIQAVVMELDTLDPQQVPAALRLLHGLNWVARHTTGVMAMVDAQDHVQVSKTLEIGAMDAQHLGQEMATVLDAAAKLAGALQASPAPGAARGTEPPSERIDPRQFA